MGKKYAEQVKLADKLETARWVGKSREMFFNKNIFMPNVKNARMRHN